MRAGLILCLLGRHKLNPWPQPHWLDCERCGHIDGLTKTRLGVGWKNRVRP
jgi:hypothetical protein